LLSGGEVRKGNPTEEGHQLASVADTQTESVLPLIEILKLFEYRWIKLDDGSPSLSAV
jgi:hypothetical protein